MERDTRVRFDRLSATELSLSLLKGRIDVDFHPQHKGEQRMAIESVAARVQVVGTRFAVQVDALGNTDVRVREGVVEVVPRSGAETQRVAAGGETLRARRRRRRVRARGARRRSSRTCTRSSRSSAGAASAAAPAAQARHGLQRRGRSAIRRRRASDAAAIAQARGGAAPAAPGPPRRGARAAARRRRQLRSPARFRVEALTLIAESYTAQGDIAHAAQAYQRAAELAPTDPAGHNARFALGRLLERYAHDDRGAASAYRRYLERAPQGALASQARQALCRLGDASYCE